MYYSSAKMPEGESGDSEDIIDKDELVINYLMEDVVKYCNGAVSLKKDAIRSISSLKTFSLSPADIANRAETSLCKIAEIWE